jgi:adenosylmethionine-8-amino-7-oxononanoate aminotransferase
MLGPPFTISEKKLDRVVDTIHSALSQVVG